MPDLREETDNNYIFGEIKMWQDGPRKHEIGVLVEAKSNEHFFAKFFQEDCIFFGFKGWEGVTQTLEINQKAKIDGIIGIIDADFRRIEKNIPSINNLFLTDYHDTEMMLIESSAWEQVIKHFADIAKPKTGGDSKLRAFEKKQEQSLKELILNLAKEIAYYRLLVEREKYPLKFRILKKSRYNYLDYHKFIDVKTLQLNIKKLEQTIENKSSKHSFLQSTDIQKKLSLIRGEVFDILELCNGHDVLNILSLALERAISNLASSKKVSGEDLEERLIIAYRLDDFQKTNLYQALVNWETSKQGRFKLLV